MELCTVIIAFRWFILIIHRNSNSTFYTVDKNVIINITTACSNSNSNDDGEAANDKDNDNSTD